VVEPSCLWGRGTVHLWESVPDLLLHSPHLTSAWLGPLSVLLSLWWWPLTICQCVYNEFL
jgi:hypothetical protein